MVSPGELWRRFLFSLQRKRLDAELQEEMRQHLELKAQEHMAEGASSEEAGYAARRKIGNLALLQEQSRASWGFPLLESIAQDVRYGVRGLGKAPGFTAAAVLTLALGIGATSAIFGVFYMVLVKPLPYHQPSRLVILFTNSPMFPGFSLGESAQDYADIKAASHSFEALAMYRSGNTNLTGVGEPERLTSLAVSSDFLPLLGVHPAIGRGLQPSDEQLASENVVLLGHDFWQRRFAGDPGIVGRAITLDQKPRTVIGVLPANSEALKK